MRVGRFAGGRGRGGRRRVTGGSIRCDHVFPNNA